MSPIDYSKYPLDWKEIVERIRLRSGDRCEQCGLHNKQKVFSVSLKIQDHDGRYKQKRYWFSDFWDAWRIHNDDYNMSIVKVILTTAHLDHDEENWDVKDDRLEHMCQQCHLRFDSKEKYRRSLNKHK